VGGERAALGGNAELVRSAMSRVRLGEIRNVYLAKVGNSKGTERLVTARAIAIGS
jgi:hypothetical protein